MVLLWNPSLTASVVDPDPPVDPSLTSWLFGSESVNYELRRWIRILTRYLRFKEI
jgi:hypothetical protein